MQEISILPLGAGCEVGRSCIILTINKKKIMLDCGLMIGRTGREALPLFEKINSEELSMILITHAHLDHCGALPYYLASTKYAGRVYMTQPTKDIYKYLLKDSLKVRIEEEQLFTSQDIENSLRKITKVDFGV
jgi:cleavage and polyadenylation specificity factor subunit 3